MILAKGLIVIDTFMTAVTNVIISKARNKKCGDDDDDNNDDDKEEDIYITGDGEMYNE